MEIYKLNMQPNPFKGCLAVFCGIDGSGKTTLLNETFSTLEREGYPVYKFKTPSKEIKRYSYQQEYELDPFRHQQNGLDLFSLCCISLADRFLLLKKTLIPLLEKEAIVLLDRYVFTSLVEMTTYNYDDADIKIIKLIIERFLAPDVSFFLQVSTTNAINRIKQRQNEADLHLDQNKFSTYSLLFQEIAQINNYLLINTNHSDITISLNEILVLMRATIANKKNSQ